MITALTEEWTGPHGLPRFDLIGEGDFAPAFERALDEARAEIAAIAADPRPADFDNTVAALERAGRMLDRVASVFFLISSTDATDRLDAVARDVTPRLAAFHAAVYQDPALFARVDAVMRAQPALTPEQARVLELTHRRFRRAGAALAPAVRARAAAIQERLAALGTAFGQAVLAEERGWALPMAPADLEGLPADLIQAMAAAAESRGQTGHVLTLARSLVEPFLETAPRRALRRTVWEAWTGRCRTPGPHDNRARAAEILALRAERAALLGHASYAAYKLETEMAGTPGAVRDLLMRVWEPARARALADTERLQALLTADGCAGPLAPWDWRYYAARDRARRHGFDAARIRPYLALERVTAAAFDAAGRLFGLRFEPVPVTLHHPDARAWAVTRDRRPMGLFIADPFARAGKRSGAWCTRLRGQSALDGPVRPIVVNVCNFARPPAGRPCLLTLDDARTLFHEFGHALHHLLSDVTYPGVAGTAVARDFVELPSQLFEHWLSTPAILDAHARHVETDQPMPGALRRAMEAAKNADQGFQTVEYLASALVDLDLHDGPPPADVLAAEAATLARIGMPAAIVPRHGVTHFQHIFAGDGYAAGYYSYLWSEVMDADAFAAFEEAGDPFDAETAARLERTILSRGGSAAPEVLYTEFRGRMPDPAALLRGRGLAA